jgi:RNA polymerase primary sigma factor
MGEAPLLTHHQEVTLGARCLKLGLQEQARVVAEERLHREPSVLEWAAFANFTGAAELVTAGAECTADADQLGTRFLREVARNRRSKEELVNSNMRLVVSIARRYQNLGVSLQDLVQEGSLGLIRAAEK